MFDVRWTDEAIAELSRLFMDAHPEDRPLITDAVNEIDQTLTTSAQTMGESRAEDFRILVIGTIAVQYRVRLHDRQAQVASVWRTTGTSARH